MQTVIKRRDPVNVRAADAAVRAAEHAISTSSPALLGDTLGITTAAQVRRRVARVLALKQQAERDLSRRDEYQRAAEELRAWAAAAYLAALHDPPEPRSS